MMLPNMTPEAIAELGSKGFQALPQLCQAAAEDAASLRSTLTSVLDSSREVGEAMQVSRLCTIHLCCVAPVGTAHLVHAVASNTTCTQCCEYGSLWACLAC